MHVGLVGLQHGGTGQHFDGLGGLGDLRLEIDAPHLIGFHHDLVHDRRLEALSLHRDLVGTQLEIAEQVSSAGIRFGLPRNSGIDIQGGDFDAWNGGGAGIGHVAGERSVKNLGVEHVGRTGQRDQQSRAAEDQQSSCLHG